MLVLVLAACDGTLADDRDAATPRNDASSRADAAVEDDDDAAIPIDDEDASTPGSDSGTPGARTVRVDGRRLLVDGAPYEIRGVCWNPVARGRTQPADFAGFVDTDAPLMRTAGINTIRTYDAITDTRVLDVLDAHGIAVFQTVYAWGGDAESAALDRVRATMGHRAVLGWIVGNEWNYNGLYTGLPFDQTRDRLERIAGMIQALDPSRPVITIYGEVPSAETIAAMPSIDMWGLNVYRGATFGDLFTRWAALSGAPMFVSEYGADAWDARDGGRENLAAQAEATRLLTEEILASSTARRGDGIVLGGTIFEWSDEWWKDQSGSPDVHDIGGIAPGGGPHPDRTFNEEWWGVVDIDRHTRPAYDALRALYAP
ncbi:glycoside hydrolase family 2 TIM barrel-domain containing protein [Sandaracinus amylolyticus]|uniref:glycoside hydrolase family 2 TIM barrel-domain containing protein n=1 Tax=Sandaracinus amylolyticus TaxID=927083 RepID=UPI001F210E5B|nr:glycoside hydrolase family 2 TIM barrel-domain containing protein [Sandaracinus amylolyticus]UJR85450.1 Hypothetical protein I5071_75300 [Sandaracinus amylolyticus]